MSTNFKPNLDSFEASLLDDLRGEVARRAAASHPAHAPRRSRRGLQLAVTGALAGLTTIGVVGLAGGPGASSAFAVERESDGDIVITLNALKDSEGLERQLADYGINAEIDYDATPSEGGPFTFEDDPGALEPLDEGELPPGAALDEERSLTAEAGVGGFDATGDGSIDPGAACGLPAPESMDDGLVITIPVDAIDKSKVLHISGSGDDASFGSIQVSYSSADGAGCGIGVAQARAGS